MLHEVVDEREDQVAVEVAAERVRNVVRGHLPRSLLRQRERKEKRGREEEGNEGRSAKMKSDHEGRRGWILELGWILAGI